MPPSLPKPRQIPFVRMRPQERKRLAQSVLALLAVFYLLFNIATHGLFDYVAADYRSFVASAEIARDHSFAAVYDLSLQREYQLPLWNYSFGALQQPFDVIPMPYLPPFVGPFLFFLWLSPSASWLAWTVLNLVVFVFYVRRLASVAGLRADPLLYVVLLTSLPAYFNWFFGQIDVWLLVFVGESLIAFRRNRDLLGGVWLAGLLVKPQMLILVLPGLVITRQFRALAGFSAAALLVGLVSVLMAGPAGIVSLLQLVAGYASLQGVASNFPESMMNWRALAVNLADIGMPQMGWAVAVPGMIATFVASLALWLRRPETTSIDYAKIWLGTFAATCIVAWHSHVHTALILIAPAIFVLADAGQSRRALNLWLYLPTVVFLGVIWLGIPAAAAFQTTNLSVPRLAHIFSGIVVFGANLGLLVWALRSQWQSRLLRSSPA